MIISEERPMLISLNWLKEFVDVQQPADALAEGLTMAGLEVDSINTLAAGLERVVVGKIVERELHPDSRHLTLCRVDVGSEVLQIVCGAPNHRKGDKVVVALPGARLPDDLAIEPTTIRGVESFGMICSEKELGISKDGAGVMILPHEATVGQPAADLLGRNDTVLEIDLTPNRPDCLSHVGVAREVAAFTATQLKFSLPAVKETGEPIDSLGAVTIQATDLCRRYTGRVISGVSIAPSPFWLQARLHAVGLRPVNNVVDVTNYVMMELGHPLHAFDYDLLSENRIDVRRAAAGEKMRTLDGVERSFPSGTLLICDGQKPVAVAGVMGGETTEVHQGTKDIFLEAAYFDPSSIRKTAKALGLHSESSHRFERGTDVEGLVTALDRAAMLIQQVAGGAIAKGRIDVYPGKQASQTVPLRIGRVRDLLGVSLSAEEITALLKTISLPVKRQDGETLVVEIPSFRVDLSREIDLIEEVVRLYGYNRVPSSVPSASVQAGPQKKEQRLVGLVRQSLVALGYRETIHYSFHNPGDLDDLMVPADHPWRNQIMIRNPLSEEFSVLRTTLLPGLLQTARLNVNRSQTELRIFEMARVFEPGENRLPREKDRIGGLIVGKAAPDGWDRPPESVDFFDLKGDLESLFESLRLPPVTWTAEDTPPLLHPGKSAWIHCGDRNIGFLGQLHPATLKRIDMDVSPVCFELDLDACLNLASEKVVYRPAIRFPSVERDIAVIVPEDLPAARLENTIRRVNSDLVKSVRVFDVYRGKPIPADKKSLALAMRFQAADRTLTDDEVNAVRDEIVAELNREFGASLRE